jgi:hypothetical protein
MFAVLGAVQADSPATYDRATDARLRSRTKETRDQCLSRSFGFVNDDHPKCSCRHSPQGRVSLPWTPAKNVRKATCRPDIEKEIRLLIPNRSNRFAVRLSDFSVRKDNHRGRFRTIEKRSIKLLIG